MSADLGLAGFQEQRKKKQRHVIVLINGKQERMCINYLMRCIGQTANCNHSDSLFHSKNKICKFNLTQPQGCWRKDHRDPSKCCPFEHYPELLNYFPQENMHCMPANVNPKANFQNNQIRIKTASCKADMLGIMCPYGAKCSFAHGTASMKEANAFVDAGLNGKQVIPFTNIMIYIHTILKKFKEVINRKILENSGTRIIERTLDPINFVHDLDDIVYISRLSKEVQDDTTGKINWISDRPDIGIMEDQYEDFIALCRKFHVCDKHVKFHSLKICDKNYKPKVDELCNHSINCKKGCHIFEGENQICFEDLCGIPCSCRFKTIEDAETNKIIIKKSIDSFSEELKKSTDPTEINRLKMCIEKYVKDYIDLNPKIHLSKLGIRLNKPSIQIDTSHITFNHKMVASKKFNYEDPEFTKLIKAEIEKKRLIQLQNTNASIIQMAFRLYKFKNIKLTLTPHNDNLHHEYLSSGAYFVGLSLERFKNVKDEFTNWSQYWRSMTFSEFHLYVLAKMEIWNSLGVETRIEDDVIIETHMPSEKDNYLNFWSWIRKVPIDQDISIIGDAKDIVQNAYDLFITYKELCPNFTITFSDWIALKPDIYKAVQLMREHSVMYICAKRYIDLDVVSSGLSVIQFSKYNHSTVKVWMKTNYEIKHLKEYKPNTLGIELIDIDTFILNEESYTEYYLGGWWDCYKEDYGFEKFISDKQNGWKYVPIKNSMVPSLRKEYEANIKAKKEQEEFIKKRLQEILEAKIKDKKQKKKKLEAIRAAKNKNVKKHNDSSSSDSSSDSDSDTDSVLSDDSDFGFKKNKNQDLNALMHVPNDNYYVFRKQTARGTYDIYIGPFESEKEAKKVMESMRLWNKKASRTMKPKIIMDDDSGMKTSWNIMFGDTTNTRKGEKNESRGIVVYEWVLNMIDYLCEHCFLSTVTCAQFHTNIDSIKFQLYEARNKPKKVIAPKVIAPKVIAPKVIAPKKVIAQKVKPDKNIAPKVMEPEKVITPKVIIPKVIAPKVKPFLKMADNSNKFDEYYEDWNDFNDEENE